MFRQSRDRQPFAYVRLSREDVSDHAEPVELKLEKRRAIALGLAAQHELIVPEDNVLIEVASAKTIERRTQFSHLLELARSGRISHLFTPYFDRLLRGSKRDEADAEDALKDGEVVVISTEGVFDFGDPNFDAAQGLAFTVRNAVSRQYLFDLSKKLKETNLVRTKRGQRSAGFAPYGYEWMRPVYRNKQEIEPGRYEVVPEEYAVVEEICRRIWQEGARTIAAGLNQRYQALGYPAPPSAHNQLGWNASTIFALVKNPFYCGFPTHRFYTKRNRMRKLPREEWVWADEAQSYPCPFSVEEWERLQGHLSARKLRGVPKLNKQSILTGVLFCSNGRHMTNKAAFYACSCREYATPHKGMAIYEPKINEVGRDLVRKAILALPVELLERSERVSDRLDAEKQHRITSQKLHEACQMRDDLMLHASTHLKIYGAEAYDAVCRKNSEQIDRLKHEVDRLQESLTLPDLREIMPLLKVVQEIGFDAFWEEAGVQEKRTMISTLVCKITLVEPRNRFVGAVTIQPQEWLNEYVRLPERLEVPLKMNRR